MLTEQQAIEWLVRFGYLRDNTNGIAPSKQDVSDAIRRHQAINNLSSTGLLDQPTSDAMEKPRCGVPDPWDGHGEIRPSYALKGCSWLSKQRSLTWKIMDSGQDISRDSARSAIGRAFNTWAAATDQLSFHEVAPDQEAIFTFGWRTAAHDDDHPFDGPGRVIAHAYYPPPCGGRHVGKCHFDDAESWTVNLPKVTDVEAIALHEIGHLLGLDHSGDTSAVMYPTAHTPPLRTLQADDAEGIRALYGHSPLPLVATAHCEGNGDISAGSNDYAGTKYLSRGVLGIKVRLVTPVPGLSVVYQAIDFGGRWMAPGRDGSNSGFNPGDTFRIFGFGVYFEGSQASNYKASYMGHFADVGDSAIFTTGQMCLAPGGVMRELEGFLVRIERR